MLWGLAGIAILFALAALAFAWTASDFRGLNPLSLRILSIPAAIGALLAALSLGPRLLRGEAMRLDAALLRTVTAMGAAGFAWPLSFGLAVALQGDVAAALGSLWRALGGALIGAVAGAIGGALGILAACTRRDA